MSDGTGSNGWIELPRAQHAALMGAARVLNEIEKADTAALYELARIGLDANPEVQTYTLKARAALSALKAAGIDVEGT